MVEKKKKSKRIVYFVIEMNPFHKVRSLTGNITLGWEYVFSMQHMGCTVCNMYKIYCI